MRPEKVGVLMVIVLEIGLITPPVVLNVFVLARLTRAFNRCSVSSVFLRERASFHDFREKIGLVIIYAGGAK
jgi:hypothetical protein